MAKSSFYSGSQQVSANSNAVEDSKNAAALSEAAAAASAAASATSAASGAASATTATTKASESASSATASATSASASQVSRVASEAAKVASETAKTAAETARDAAAASSTSASSSQAAASTSETNSASSAAAALVSENAAAASETAASASASAASTSEANAAASETAAAASETAAATSETNAATSETNAATSETNAATSETNAASSASSAASSASAASTSATSASNAQTAAEAARDATLTAYDNFDDRYLGAKASAPTVDNDGDALVAGSLYFDTVSGSMKVYTGSAWVAAYVSSTDYLPFSGGTMTGNLAFGDDVKATFGNSADLQVFHDGSNSYIQDAGTGNLFVQASNVLWLRDASGTAYFSGTSGNEVALYHNGSEKLATTSTGIDVTGKITADDELKIESTSGYGIIEVGGPSGALIDLKSPFSDDYDGRILTTGDGVSITGSTGNPVNLQYNNATKLATTSTGIDVTGTVVADGLTVDGDAAITNSGHFLVGKTSRDSTNTVGAELKDTGEVIATVDGAIASYLNRKTSDGDILQFRKDNIAVGSIGSTSGGLYVDFGNWTITESGGSLYFATGGTNKMKLDASGNLDVVGSVNSNATIS